MSPWLLLLFLPIELSILFAVFHLVPRKLDKATERMEHAMRDEIGRRSQDIVGPAVRDEIGRAIALIIPAAAARVAELLRHPGDTESEKKPT